MESKDNGIIFRDIPDPKPGELVCPCCGGDLTMNDILALNHKDPVRSLVSLRQNFMCAPVIGSIMPGAELTNPPTTQGVMIDFSCEDCCDEPGLLCLGSGTTLTAARSFTGAIQPGSKSASRHAHKPNGWARAAQRTTSARSLGCFGP